MKIPLTIALVILLFGLVNCTNQNLKKGNIVVKSNIVNNPIYKILDQKKEANLFGYDTVQKLKTNNVVYYSSRMQRIDSAMAGMYNCKSSLSGDTLEIELYINGLLTGWGFYIDCKNKYFTIKPYYFTDVIEVGKKPRSFEVLNQYLALNKNNYKLNDSVFGKVQFELTEHYGNQKITHKAEGFFRGKVLKR